MRLDVVGHALLPPFIVFGVNRLFAVGFTIAIIRRPALASGCRGGAAEIGRNPTLVPTNRPMVAAAS
jgi:hypothetical protein